MTHEPEVPPPFLRIVRGAPSAEEIAALVAVLSSVSRGRGAAVPAPRYAWSARSRLVRAPMQTGQGGWRASARPR